MEELLGKPLAPIMSWHASIILIPLWLLLTTHGASSVAEKNEDEDLIKQGVTKRGPSKIG